MIFVKDMLYAVLALIALVIAAGSFYFYTTSGDNKAWLVACVLFVLLALVSGGLFLSGRVNKGEDIHITE